MVICAQLILKENKTMFDDDDDNQPSPTERMKAFKQKYTLLTQKKSGRRGPGGNRKPPKRYIPIDVEAMDVRAPQDKATGLDTLWQCTDDQAVKKWFTKGQSLFSRKVCKALRHRLIPDAQKATVQRLMSLPGATSNLALVNQAVAQEAFHQLHRWLVTLAEAHPDWKCVFATAISGDGETSHTQTEIELYESQRRFASTCRTISPHFFAITELAIFNSQGHPGGGQRMSRHEHALIFGPSVRLHAGLIAAKQADRYPPNFTKAPVLDVRHVPTDPVNLCRMAAYLFKAPSKMMNWNPAKDDKPGHMNQSEKGDRYTRYLRLAYLRSMLTFEQLTFAGGEGNRIRSDMIKYLRSVTENAAAGGTRILHPDEIGSFWNEISKDLGLTTWNVPIIKTTK